MKRVHQDRFSVLINITRCRTPPGEPQRLYVETEELAKELRDGEYNRLKVDLQSRSDVVQASEDPSAITKSNYQIWYRVKGTYGGAYPHVANFQIEPSPIDYEIWEDGDPGFNFELGSDRITHP